METKSIWSLLWPLLLLTLSLSYAFDVPLKNVLRSSFPEPYAAYLRRFQKHAGDLGQHRPTIVSHTIDSNLGEHARMGASNTWQADDTITSFQPALLSDLSSAEVPPVVSATHAAIPGAVNRGGGGPGGCSSTDAHGTCLLVATNPVEQNAIHSAHIRGGSGPGGCGPAGAAGTCSQQAFLNVGDHEASDHPNVAGMVGKRLTIIPQPPASV